MDEQTQDQNRSGTQTVDNPDSVSNPLESGRPPTIPDTTNPEGSRSQTFTGQIAEYSNQLERDFHTFESSLSSRERDQELEDLDWDELEKRYKSEMDSKTGAEREIMDEFSARFQQFMMWMQVSNERESDRATKRLRTRMAFVQHSEDQLSDKQEQYAKVLDAFQSAMALLRNL